MRGPLLVLALLVVVAGALFGGTWWYSQHQYYVSSNGQDVIVYKGIKGSILGINFSSAIENTHIPIDSLPSFERDRIVDGITAHSRSAAERIVDGVRPVDADPDVDTVEHACPPQPRSHRVRRHSSTPPPGSPTPPRR